MAISILNVTKQYEDGEFLTETQLDAAFDSISSWSSAISTEVPDKSGSDTIVGPWTFSVGGLKVSGAGSGVSTLAFATTSSDRIHTFPDAAGILVLEDNAATLTNKTIAAPSISDPTLSGNISGSPTFDDGQTFSSVCTFSDEISLAAIDPPTANRANRNGIVKGWVKFNGSGTIQDSYNVSSVNHDSTGRYTITWDTNFANDDYCILATPFTGNPQFCSVGSQTTGSTQVRVFNSTSGTAINAVTFVMAIGDQ